MKIPLPEDFGVTPELVERYKAHESLLQRYSVIVTNVLAWIVFPAGIYFLVFRNFSWWYAVAAFLVGLFIAEETGSRLPRLVVRRLPKHKQVQQYLSSFAEYSFYRRQKENDYRKSQEDFWKSLSGHQFEHEVARLFSCIGFQTTVTKGSGDQGIDIEMSKDGKEIIVQCKAHKKPVGPHVIRDLYGTLMNCKYDRAILVSLTGWTSGVSAFVQGKPIELMSISDLVSIQKSLLQSKYEEL